jgi:hypothetical protein
MKASERSSSSISQRTQARREASLWKPSRASRRRGGWWDRTSRLSTDCRLPGSRLPCLMACLMARAYTRLQRDPGSGVSTRRRGCEPLASRGYRWTQHGHRFDKVRATPPGVNLRPRLTFEALSGYGGSARWFHRGRGVPRWLERTHSRAAERRGSGAAAARPGSGGSSRSVLVESRCPVSLAPRARVYLKMILGIHRSHVY